MKPRLISFVKKENGNVQIVRLIWNKKTGKPFSINEYLALYPDYFNAGGTEYNEIPELTKIRNTNTGDFDCCIGKVLYSLNPCQNVLADPSNGKNIIIKSPLASPEDRGIVIPIDDISWFVNSPNKRMPQPNTATNVINWLSEYFFFEPLKKKEVIYYNGTPPTVLKPDTLYINTANNTMQIMYLNGGILTPYCPPAPTPTTPTSTTSNLLVLNRTFTIKAPDDYFGAFMQDPNNADTLIPLMGNDKGEINVFYNAYHFFDIRYLKTNTLHGNEQDYANFYTSAPYNYNSLVVPKNTILPKTVFPLSTETIPFAGNCLKMWFFRGDNMINAPYSFYNNKIEISMEFELIPPFNIQRQGEG